jgi:hypothetical protein
MVLDRPISFTADEIPPMSGAPANRYSGGGDGPAPSVKTTLPRRGFPL